MIVMIELTREWPRKSGENKVGKVSLNAAFIESILPASTIEGNPNQAVIRFNEPSRDDENHLGVTETRAEIVALIEAKQRELWKQQKYVEVGKLYGFDSSGRICDVKNNAYLGREVKPWVPDAVPIPPSK